MWLLIDGDSWFHADWYGGGPRAADNFMNRIEDLIAKYGFDRTVVAFDSHPSWRKSVFEAYKSKRSEKPDGFDELFAELKQRARDKYEVMEFPNMEADDIVAALAGEAVEEGEKAVICSADKDLHQCLVDGFVSQAIKVNREFGGGLKCKFVTAKMLKKQYGVWPEQWVDYRSLTGDMSDCIPGCFGVGEDAARKVLESCQDLDDFKANPEKPKLGPKTRERLLEFIDSELALYRRIIKLGHCDGVKSEAEEVEF